MKKSKQAWKVVGPYVNILGDVYENGAIIPANTLHEIDEAWLQDQGHIVPTDAKSAPAPTTDDGDSSEEETD